MKKLLIIVTLFIALTTTMFSQFRNEIEPKENIYDALTKPAPNLILGIFNPENFSMKHSYSLAYSSFGSNGLGLGIYTNSMAYKFNDKLNARLDVSLSHSPFGSYDKNLTDKFTGIFINRAEVNYKPFDNFYIQVQYRQLPGQMYSNYSPYGYRYSDPFFGSESNDFRFMNR